jgi:hypothetical protein
LGIPIVWKVIVEVFEVIWEGKVSWRVKFVYWIGAEIYIIKTGTNKEFTIGEIGEKLN